MKLVYHVLLLSSVRLVSLSGDKYWEMMFAIYGEYYAFNILVLCACVWFNRETNYGEMRIP